MSASKHEKIAIIQNFLTWVTENSDELIVAYADEVLVDCDTAIAHGPGHQSMSPCILTGPHTHHESDMGHEWDDSKITTQTTKGHRHIDQDKTYRLAFEHY